MSADSDVYGLDQELESTTERNPLLNVLQQELSQSIKDFQSWRSRAEDNDETRFCTWDGQSDDGRKHERDLGKEPFPWEGASDTRVRLADSLVNERVMLMTRAFANARLQVLPTDSTDVTKARLSTDLLKWMMSTHMSAELRREIALAANWREDKGAAIMGIFWRTETRLESRTITMDEIAAMDPDLAAAVFDPMREDYVIEAAQKMIPMLTKAESARALKDLQTTGQAEVYEPKIFSSRPTWQALLPGVDVVFPARCWDLQRSRFIARRERLTLTELRERVMTEDYDPDFVAEAEKHICTTPDPLDGNLLENKNTNSDGLHDQYVEIWHTYYKATAKGGIPRVFCTVLHKDISDMQAKHEEHSYEHGLYPFVEMVRERSRRAILDSRGIPEIVQTSQAEIKMQRDYRADRASISILPPFKYPANRGKIQMIMGPGKAIPIRRAGEEFGWMSPPPNDAGTKEVEESVRVDVDEYFGVMTNWSKQMPISRQQIHQQDLVGNFLGEMKECLSQTFQLMQQYMEPVEVMRVTNAQVQPLKATREEIQGRYDLMLEFDVRDLDMEYVGKKAEMISKIVAPLDVAGVLDRGKLVEFLMNWIDPVLSRELVKQGDAASMAEVEDEQVQFTKIAAGVEPVNKEQGQNYQVRLRALQDIVQKNPAIQQRMQQDEVFRSLLENRVKFLSFQVQQQQNAQIGRTGVAPAL